MRKQQHDPHGDLAQERILREVDRTAFRAPDIPARLYRTMTAGGSTGKTFLATSHDEASTMAERAGYEAVEESRFARGASTGL